MTGLARAGKDTVGWYLEKEYGFSRYSFARPIKEIARVMFGLTSEWVDPKDKEAIHPYWGISVREMWQKIGTECGREIFFTDIWVKLAELSLKLHDIPPGMESDLKVVITDVRFDNEAQWIHRQGGEVWKILRAVRSVGVEGHKSEAGVSRHLIDRQISNLNDKAELYRRISWALKGGPDANLPV